MAHENETMIFASIFNPECPGRVMPVNLANAAERGDIDAFLKGEGMECCECGCCSYVCPAKRHLTQTIAGTRKLVLASRKK